MVFFSEFRFICEICHKEEIIRNENHLRMNLFQSI